MIHSFQHLSDNYSLWKWTFLLLNVWTLLVWHYFLVHEVSNILSSCLHDRDVVPLGLRWCDVPSGLLCSCRSRLSDAVHKFGSFNSKQGSNYVAYVVCTAPFLSFHETCELWSDYAQRRVNLFTRFVVFRVSRLELTTAMVAQGNCPLCLCYYHG